VDETLIHNEAAACASQGSTRTGMHGKIAQPAWRSKGQQLKYFRHDAFNLLARRDVCDSASALANVCTQTRQKTDVVRHQSELRFASRAIARQRNARAP
jgi:hypothetical protein